MKFSSILAVASTFSALSFAAPSPSPNTLEKRLSPADEPAATSRMAALYTDIKQYTAIINSTADALSDSTNPLDAAAAGPKFTAAIASINALVVGATNDVNSGDLAKRQVPAGGLPAQLALIIVEIGGALNRIIAILGLTVTLSFLGPLVGSLSLLLASLIPVVSNLLAVVGALVNGVLGGLSLALAGLF
ncbi:MAG: hypothetical protein Q9174_006511 [Haloplaca sp. 1 TL-2023]